MKFAVVLAICFLASGATADTRGIFDSIKNFIHPKETTTAKPVDCAYVLSLVTGGSNEEATTTGPPAGKREAPAEEKKSSVPSLAEIVGCLATSIAPIPVMGAGKRSVEEPAEPQVDLQTLFDNFKANYQGQPEKRQLAIATDPSDCPGGKPDYAKFVREMKRQYAQYGVPAYYLDSITVADIKEVADETCRNSPYAAGK